jgi:DNA polymerase-3 subunit beta
MKLLCNTKNLLSTLSIATHACASGSTLPMLSAVMIVADAATQRVRIFANNLDLSINTSFSTKVEADGAICIEGQRFRGIVAAVQGEECNISTDARHRLTLKCGSSTFNLMGIGADEFPKMTPVPDTAVKMDFKQADLLAILNAVCAAQSEDETRYILNGICLQRGGTNLDVVATDGRRMHVNAHTIAEIGETVGTILPSKNVVSIMALLGETGTASIAAVKNLARIVISREAGDIEITSKVVEGSYPNWKQVIPIYEHEGVKLNREDLIGAFSRVKLALDEKHTAVKVTLKDDSLLIIGESPSHGEGREILAYVVPSKLRGEFSANANFVLEALRGLVSEFVTLTVHHATASTSPLLFTDGAGSMIVIMPVRLS